MAACSTSAQTPEPASPTRAPAADAPAPASKVVDEDETGSDRPGSPAAQPDEDRPEITSSPDSARELDAGDAGDAGDTGIRQLDETHYVIRRDLIEGFFADPTPYSRQVRVVPAIEDGNAIGFKLYAVRPSSIFARLGLRNGDLVQAINGMSVENVEKLLQAYQQLQQASRIELDITRRGKPVQLVIDVESAP